MSKAGMAILLSLLFLVVSGVNTKTFAQQKLTILDKGNVIKDVVCNSLVQNFFITKEDHCQQIKELQNDLSEKASSSTTPADFTNTISYATDPTFYQPTPTETQTITPTPTIIVASSITPSPLDQTPLNNFPAQGPDLNSDVIFDLINAYRAQIGKPAFIKDDNLCSLAKTRSFEIYGELFEGKGALHSGLYNRNLPYWITEDAKYGSNEAGTVNWWLHSPIHRAAIEGNDVYSCGACSGTVCSQLFTSYTPKSGVKIQPTVTPSS